MKQYNRGRQKPHTSLSPLTRVVDIARPDARVARNFRRTVDRYISDGSGAGEIVHWLRTWEGNHARFAPLVATSPMLKEVAPLSAVLAQLSTFGLEALDHLEKGETKPNLQAASKDVIEKAREPNGQVELAVVSAIEKLVMAASQQNSTR